MIISVLVCEAQAASLYDPGDVLVVDFAPTDGGPPKIVAVDPTPPYEASLVAEGGFLGSPRGLTVDVNGDVLVTDNTEPTDLIVRIDANTGEQSVVMDLALPSGAFLGNPDRLGNTLFVPAANSGGREVFAIDLEMATSTSVTAGGFLLEPDGLIVESAATLLVADQLKLIRVHMDTGFQSILLDGDATAGVRDLVLSEGIVTFISSVGVVRLDPTFGATLISQATDSFRPYSIDALPDGTLVVAVRLGGNPELFLVNPSDGARQAIYSSDQLIGVTVAPVPEPSSILGEVLSLAVLLLLTRETRVAAGRRPALLARSGSLRVGARPGKIGPPN